jgi:hypothetical protein
MAYSSGSLPGWAKDVIERFEWQEHVLAWFHGAKHVRHVDAVPRHDDGLAFGDGAVEEVASENVTAATA